MKIIAEVIMPVYLKNQLTYTDRCTHSRSIFKLHSCLYTRHNGIKLNDHFHSFIYSSHWSLQRSGAQTLDHGQHPACNGLSCSPWHTREKRQKYDRMPIETCILHFCSPYNIASQIPHCISYPSCLSHFVILS